MDTSFDIADFLQRWLIKPHKFSLAILVLRKVFLRIENLEQQHWFIHIEYSYREITSELYKIADHHVPAEGWFLAWKVLLWSNFFQRLDLCSLFCNSLILWWKCSIQLFFRKSLSKQLFLLRSSTVVKVL